MATIETLHHFQKKNVFSQFRVWGKLNKDGNGPNRLRKIKIGEIKSFITILTEFRTLRNFLDHFWAIYKLSK